MQEHEAHGGDEAKITTDVEVRRYEMIDLVRSDAFAMSFQSIKQYREALIRVVENSAPQPAPDVAGLVEALRILGDIKDWDCDVSGGFLSIPVGLRRRIQEILAGQRKQGGEA